MLARTYKTAQELGLLEHEYEALREVLRRLEDGRISLDRVIMETFHCGTMHCLAGWATVINGKAFPETLWWRDNFSLTPADGSAHLVARLPPALTNVFGITSRMLDADGAEARACLRHYLETGEFRDTHSKTPR